MTMFMTNRNNFYYEVMSFGLKNTRAMYHRLVDIVFSKQISQNLEVYFVDMIIKFPDEGQHGEDFKDALALVRKYNMCLNPNKCLVGVYAGKFLQFMLTSRGIEANQDNCIMIINMRRPTSVKEVQQVSGKIVA